MKKLRININGKELTGFAGQSILDIARENDIEIPTLCFDDRTEIYGSCGLCNVEVEGNPKMVKACATPITDGMVVTTESQRIYESRKTNLELLLSKHIGDCVAPCKRACPAETDCQGYVGHIANGEFGESLELIKDKLPLPGCIGRVCPHPCETACRHGLIGEPIAIAHLKRFAADMDMASGMFMPEIAEDSGKQVAIVGGGPAGLTAAYYLRQKGHSVNIYDAMPKMGGMLRYGIPEYRLPKDIVDKEAEHIQSMGVGFINNVKIGTDITFAELQKAYDAVYIALGAWVSSGLRVDGVDAEGVIGGIEMLQNMGAGRPLKIGERVAVVGGGNTAMDACRTAVRLGAKEVYNVYRRTVAEMPAEPIEITEAQEEGVIFKNLTNPSEIIKDENGHVKGMRLQIMELGEPDESGRRRPVPVEGQEEVLDVDTVILAIGQGINPEGFEGLDLTKYNTVIADESTFQTNIPGVFAGGDCINDGAGIAIAAIGEAQKAAIQIDNYLHGVTIPYVEPYWVTREDITEDYFAGRQKTHRPPIDHLSPEERKENFAEIMEGFTPEAAMAEGNRCLECGCQDYFECELIKYANDYDVAPGRLAGENPHVEVEDDHPFIERNPDKCILCGRCVRACDEIIGVSALGFVNRGFDTIVEPALGGTFQESGCISCGTCIAVCPTGALLERAEGHKRIPTDTTKTLTTCGYCGAGCQMTVEAMGDIVVKASPVNDMELVNEGVMCGRGRFGTGEVQLGERLTSPLVRNKAGELVEADWYDAFVAVAKGAQTVTARHGEEALKVALSPKFTTEEISAMASLAGQLGAQTFSFATRTRGEDAVLGADSPRVQDMNALLGADAILVVGALRFDNPVLRYKLQEAAAAGADVFAINPKADGLEKVGDEFIVEGEDISFLAEVLKAVVDAKGNLSTLDGYAELQQSLATIEVSDEAQIIAKGLLAAKNPIVVVGSRRTTVAGATLAADLAALLAPVPGARRGLMRIEDQNNATGLRLLGTTAGAEVLDSAKGLIIFGEDADFDTNGLEFLAVMDTHLTATAAKADVVLPQRAFPEVGGSFFNAEGRYQKVKRAIESPVEYSNIAAVHEIAKVLGSGAQTNCAGKIWQQLCDFMPELAGVKPGEVLSLSHSPVAIALKPYDAEAALFAEAANTDYLMKNMEAKIQAVITDVNEC